jgi:hypothetical protein
VFLNATPENDCSPWKYAFAPLSVPDTGPPSYIRTLMIVPGLVVLSVIWLTVPQ